MQLADALRLAPGDVVAFVGGGGKTSAMFHLAEKVSLRGRRVLITTSTRIFAAQIKLAPAHLTFDPSRQSLTDLLPRLQAALDQHGQVLLIGQADPDSGKAFGIAPEVVDALAQTSRFDLILNEADGSRMRPFKAPAAHEPVIPTSTTQVVPVVGLDIVGQPLNDDHVHRAEVISRLSGVGLNQPVTPQVIADVLTHPQGGIKNAPQQARVIPLLNKCETPERRQAAGQIADHVLRADRIEAVAIGAIHRRADPISRVVGRTAVIVLAAGGSRRFGSPKQLAPWQGQTFIERAVDTALTAAGVHSVTVVLGAEIEQCQALLKGWPVHIVINERWAEGQSTSIQAGLAAMPDNVGAAVFMLVDLPGIPPNVITGLIERHRQTLAPIVWPEFEGRRGNPLLFDRTLFPELRAIRGDSGGRPLIRAYRNVAEGVAVETPAILQDFDRPEDLEKARSSRF